MKPNIKFLDLPKSFWASVRSVSQEVGYTVRGEGKVKVPSHVEIMNAFIKLKLKPEKIIKKDKPTILANNLADYYKYRATLLNDFVEPRLMDVDKARRVFNSLRKQHKPSCPIPMNKQKGKKRAPAYLTSIINILAEANLEGMPCDFDPRELTAVAKNGVPLRTLSRRVDGAFPKAINPIAIWEIKEYYYTTTFGRRVADGVYESLLDGMELEELFEHEKIKVLHYLMLDAHFTWWGCGKPYLCRIIDMLHMGYVDEVLFGYEIIERLPNIVKDWLTLEKAK